MLDAVTSALPADIARLPSPPVAGTGASPPPPGDKIKKKEGEGPCTAGTTENPDILRTIGHHQNRPHLVVGLRRRNGDVIANAQGKLRPQGARFHRCQTMSPMPPGIMGGGPQPRRAIGGVSKRQNPRRRGLAGSVKKDEGRRKRLAGRMRSFVPAKT